MQVEDGPLQRFQTWFRFGHWLNTPQGIALLLSIPVCWSVAALRFAVPDVAEVRVFSSPTWLYLFSPFLGFLAFIRIAHLPLSLHGWQRFLCA
jgi:hypothetical protein